jgi:hypothetical protein
MITAKQAVRACILAQYLSNGFKTIDLFRYDPVERYIYILSGDEIEIKIFEDGNWRFL